MATPRVEVIRTGVANLASVLAGFRRVGADARLTEDPAAVAAADFVMLPGVGAFGAAMERLHAMGMVEVVRARFRENRPTMAICVGLQVLCESSEESPGVTGLGILPTTVRRFPNSVRVPQLGWNRIEAEEGCRYLRTGFCYFANSYHATAVPAGWKAAMADHGGPFVAGLERGATLACQFHPELSGAHGKELLARWLAESPKEAARC